MAFEVSDAYKEGYWAGVSERQKRTLEFARELENYIKRLELVPGRVGTFTYKRPADQP